VNEGENMRTSDAVWGLPVLDVLKDCRNTRKGWYGINKAGQRVNVLNHPENADADSPARIPRSDFITIVPHRNYSGGPVGIILIERTRARRRK
jgi:hypothetical protein